MIEVGTHEVFVKSTALSEAKSGNLQILVEFQDELGQTLNAFLHTTEKAWPHTEEKLRLLGWDAAANGYRFEDLNNEPSPMYGAPAQIVVVDEDYEGKPKRKVKYINAPGGKSLERMPEQEAKSFAEQLRQRLTGSPRAGVAKPTPKPAAPANGAAGDDMPF